MIPHSAGKFKDCVRFLEGSAGVLLGLVALGLTPLAAVAHTPEAHRHLAAQGIDRWLASRWRFDPARRELTAYREQIENGAVEEDFIGTLPFLEHFYHPATYEGLWGPQGFREGLGQWKGLGGLTDWLGVDPLGVIQQQLEQRSALTRAEELWAEARQRYAAGEREEAYFLVGRVAHLLADLSVPAHVHGDPHAGKDQMQFQVRDLAHLLEDLPANLEQSVVRIARSLVNPDSYEQYTAEHYAEWGSGLQISPNLAAYGPPVRAANLAELFDHLAWRTLDFDSNDRDGRADRGRRNRSGSLSDADCAAIAAELMPQAITHTAGLFTLFWRETHPWTVWKWVGGGVAVVLGVGLLVWSLWRRRQVGAGAE
jgi:hypothetical protein